MDHKFTELIKKWLETPEDSRLFTHRLSALQQTGFPSSPLG